MESPDLPDPDGDGHALRLFDAGQPILVLYDGETWESVWSGSVVTYPDRKSQQGWSEVTVADLLEFWITNH